MQTQDSFPEQFPELERIIQTALTGNLPMNQATRTAIIKSYELGLAIGYMVKIYPHHEASNLNNQVSTTANIKPNESI